MLKAKHISDFLKTKLIGKDLDIDYALPITEIYENCISFVKNEISDEIIQFVNEHPKNLLILPKTYDKKIKCSYIISKNPRLDFIKVLDEYYYNLNHLFKLPQDIKEREYVNFGQNCSINKFARIGHGTTVGHNVVIEGNVIIRENCIIKSGAIIGDMGFGFEFEEGKPIRFPHVGYVKIGNNVEIGANTVICRGTLGETSIGDETKIDDQVFIAHNVKIGKSCIIVAKSEISGSVEIGDNAWLGPGCTIQNQIKIGKGAVIGTGAVVTKDVGEYEIVAGVPAKFIRKRNQGEYF